MSVRPKKQTAAELLAELEEDPVFVERRLAREEAVRLRDEEPTRAEAAAALPLAKGQTPHRKKRSAR